MFPIRDHNPSEQTPYVTWGLIALNIAVFLWLYAGAGSPMARDYAIYQWGMIPARLSHGQGFSTLITAMFLHGGWWHLAGNMLFLWIFGDNLEAAFGRVRFLGFYLSCGIAAALAQFAAEPNAIGPVIGASGAIAGVLGGYLLLYPKARIDVLFIFIVFFRVFQISAWIVLSLWLGLQVFDFAGNANGSIAYWEHFGGFAMGLLLTLPAKLRQKPALALSDPPARKTTISVVRRRQ